MDRLIIELEAHSIWKIQSSARRVEIMN
uniref:Uncharacterized protein n=1 Tax=Arundo donax TaxID=35708 RepID=A0A0A8ZLT4_ARUDO